MAPEALNAAPVLRRWAHGVASATVALQAAEPCGDAAAWLTWPAPAAGSLLAIVDGLGHGPEAALAAEAALQALSDATRGPAQPLPLLMQRLDAALARLRGAAVGLVQVQGGRMWHAGVGNARVMRWRAAQLTRLPSQNGIVGGGLPAQLQVTELSLAPGDWLLMFTDGLDERLSLPLLLPEWQRDPALLCQHLLLRHRLGRDDAGILVMHVGAD